MTWFGKGAPDGAIYAIVCLKHFKNTRKITVLKCSRSFSNDNHDILFYF